MNIRTETQPVMLKIQEKYTNDILQQVNSFNCLRCNVLDIYARNANKTFHKF
jgi:hypothetical protein